MAVGAFLEELRAVKGGNLLTPRMTAPDPRASLPLNDRILTNPAVSKLIDMLSGGLKTAITPGAQLINTFPQTLKSLEPLGPAIRSTASNLMQMSPMESIKRSTGTLKFIEDYKIKTGQEPSADEVVNFEQTYRQQKAQNPLAEILETPMTLAAAGYGMAAPLTNIPKLAAMMGISAVNPIGKIKTESPLGQDVRDIANLLTSGGLVEGVSRIPKIRKSSATNEVISAVKSNLENFENKVFKGNPNPVWQKMTEDAKVTAIIQAADTNPILGDYISGIVKKGQSQRMGSLLFGEKGQAEIPLKKPEGEIPKIVPPVPITDVLPVTIPSTPEATLIEEAKKYKTAEEWVEAKLENLKKESISSGAGQKTLDFLKTNSENLNPDGTITLYHGTAFGASISKTGINPFSYLTTDKNVAKQFGKVFEIKSDPTELIGVPQTMAGGKGVILQNPLRLIKGEDGIYRLSTKADVTKPVPGVGLPRDITPAEFWQKAQEVQPIKHPLTAAEAVKQGMGATPIKQPEPAGWEEEPQPIKPSEPPSIQDRAEMEVETLNYTGSQHPLEKAMKEIGKIRAQAKGKESEEYREIPWRFKSTEGKPIDEVRQELEGHGIIFESDSELRQALKDLGEKQQRFTLTPEVQTFLKTKANVEALGKKLEQKISPRAYKRIIYSNVGLKSIKTPLVTTKEAMFKRELRQEVKASIQGEKYGRKIQRVRQQYVSNDKETALKRKAELARLKENILTRDKESTRRGRIVAEYDAEIEAINNKYRIERLKTDIKRRYEIKDIKEMAEERNADIERIRGFLVEYTNENLPPEVRFKLLPEIRDIKTNKNLGNAILKVEKIKDKIEAEKKAIEDAKRFTPEQRKELYQAALNKGLIIEKADHKHKDRLAPLLSHYKNASFGEVKNYIAQLQGSQENPSPKILKMYRDINKDAEVMELINKMSAGWVDINKVETGTLDPIRQAEKVSRLDSWDNDNVLTQNIFDVIAGADFERFKRFEKELRELHDTVGLLAETKASADLMRKFEMKEALTEKEQKSIDFLRGKYDTLIEEANAVRQKLGKPIIPYRKDYMTHIVEHNLLTEFFKGDIRQMGSITTTQMDAIRKGDFTKGNMKFNQFALKRKGPTTKYDAVGNYQKYLETLLYEIYMTPAVAHARKFSEYALLRLPNYYKATTALLDRLAGKPSSYDRTPLAQAVFSNDLTKWLRKQIAKNALIGNISFNAINLSNITTNVGELGRYSLKGLKGFLGDEELRHLAFQHSSMLKSRKSQFDADVKAINVFNINSLDKLNAIEKGKVAGKQLQYLVEGMTRIIEYNNVGSTWVGAYLKAVEKLKFSQDKAFKYADAIARRTQVGYRSYELPEIMASDMGKTLGQFQTWTFNAMNHLIYDLKLGNIPNQILKPFSGSNKPTDVQYKKFFLLLAAALLVNAAYKRAGLREPTSITSIAPRISFPAGRIIRAAGDIGRAGARSVGIDEFLGQEIPRPKKETTERAVRTLATTALPYGGAQISRFAEGRILPDRSKYQTKDVVRLYKQSILEGDKQKEKEADNMALELGLSGPRMKERAKGKIQDDLKSKYDLVGPIDSPMSINIIRDIPPVERTRLIETYGKNMQKELREKISVSTPKNRIRKELLELLN